MRTHKSINLRKALLAGTAIVAVGAFSTGAHAAASDLKVDTNDSNNGVYETDGGNPLDLTTHTGKDIRVDVTGQITVANGETIGNSDDTYAGLTAGATGQTVTITNTEDDVDTTVTVANGIVAGQDALNLAVTAVAAGDGNTETLTVDVNGALNLGTGTVTITSTSDGNAENTATLNVSGDVTSGTITLQADDANGGAGTAAALVLDGTAAGQTVSSTIVGADADDGRITVNNTHASGVTFTGAIGQGGAANVIDSIVVNNDGSSQAVTFTNSVNAANGITLGGGSTDDTVTATFGGSSATTITGVVAGGAAGDTVAVNVLGGDTVTFANDIKGNIDTVTISGNTTLVADDELDTTGAVTIESGSTLDAGDDTVDVAGGIANSGTLKLTGTSTITADITGTGALNLDAAGTIAGSVTQNTADVAGVAVDITTGDTYNVGTTTFSDDGTLDFDATARTITGNFTNTTDGDGTIIVANGTNTTAFVGNLGASVDNSLKALTVETGGNNIVTFTGNLYVDTITTNDAGDELQFLGSTGSTQVVSGTIDDNGDDGEGIIRVGNDTLKPTVRFDGTIGAGNDFATLEVNEGATAYLNADSDFDTAVTIDTGATLRIGSGDTLTADAGGTITNNGTIQIDVANADGGALVAGDFGQIASANEELDTDGISINVTGLLGTTANDLDPFGALTFDEAKQLTDNSALYTFTVDATDQVDVALVSTSSITKSTGSKNAADALLSVGSAATGDLLLVQNAFASAGDDTVDDVAEAATTVNSNVGGVAAGLSVGNTTAGLNSARLASLRDGFAQTGMAAGNGAEGLKVWGQVFGSTGDQDERDGISGYDVDSYGFAAGVDTENLAEDMVVGLAFSYADTDVDSKGISNAKTEIDSYQLALYGDYDIDERTYLSGQVSYMWSDNDTSRNPGGVSSITASGDYDASQWGARAELGRDYDAGEGLMITPSALLNYVHYDADGYTETGAGTANTTTSGADLDVFEVGVGLDATWTVENADGSYFQPTLGLGVRHDLIGDEYSATNQFAGGGAAFAVEGFDPAQTTFDVGAGVTYYTTGGWDLSAEYNYEIKSDYDSHGGLLKAAYNF